MPTQIIDGFKLNAATPIDSRLVTTGTSSRNSMVYKYEGLRVYDTIQKMPFVYIDGDWQEESVNTITNTSGGSGNMLLGGTPNYIPKITSTGTDNSNIREYTVGNERRIGINVPTGQITSTLQVGGTITATNFVGTIASTYINGIINLNQIQNANDNNKKFVLKSILNSNQWVEETTGNKIIIDNNVNAEKLFLVLSDNKETTGIGNSLYIANNNTTNDLIAANTKTRQLMLGTTNNSLSAPQYSFIGNTNTGMYGSGTDIGLTLLGAKRIYVDSTSVGINVGGTTIAKFETGTMSITGATNITGNTTISGTTIISGANTFTVGTGATTLGGTLNVTDNTTLNGTITTINSPTTITGTNTFTVGSGATTLGGTLTVTGDTTLNKTSISGANTFTVGTGATTLGGTLNVTGNTTLSAPLIVSTSTSPGIKITSSGEPLRSIQSSGVNLNFISFYKTDTANPADLNGRRGYIGYGSTVGDVFYIYNETATGSINFHTNGNERFIISNNVATIKTPVIIESNLANATDSGLIIKDTSAGNRGAFWMTPFLNNGQFNTTVRTNDFGLLFSSKGYNVANGSNGFVIAPHSNIEGGIRIDDTGRIEAHGGLAIGSGDYSSNSGKIGTIMNRIVVGSVNVARDGAHVINKGSNYVQMNPGQGTSTSGTVPVAAIQFKTAMPSANYNVFVSFSHSVNAYPWTCVAEVVDATNFKICVARTDTVTWVSGALEVSFMAVHYDN